MEREHQDALIALWNEQYRPRIIRQLIYRGVPLHDAEDAMQGALAKAIHCLRAGHGPRTSVEGWLFTLAWHAAMDHRKKTARQDGLRRKLGESGMARDFADSLDEISQSEVSEAVAAAIASLTTSQRHVLTRYVYGRQSIADIARELGISRGAVAGRLERGLNKLRQALSQCGINAHS